MCYLNTKPMSKVKSFEITTSLAKVENYIVLRAKTYLLVVLCRYTEYLLSILKSIIFSVIDYRYFMFFFIKYNFIISSSTECAIEPNRMTQSRKKAEQTGV